MKELTVCILAAVLLLGACNGKSEDASAPLAALQSPNAAENYGYPFWNDQFQRKTELWEKGLSFCQQPDHKFLVNCQAVLAVAAPRIPFPTAMPSNGPGTTFNFAPVPPSQNKENH